MSWLVIVAIIAALSTPPRNYKEVPFYLLAILMLPLRIFRGDVGCWADKIGIAAVALFSLFVWAVSDNPAFLAEPFSQQFKSLLWLDLVFVVVPIWLPLRLIDLIAGGPRRRRGIIIVRPD